jgi:hypothetical protein
MNSSRSSSATVALPTSRRSWLATMLAAALVAASGGCALSAEADLPDVEVTQHDISIGGIPMAGRQGDVSTHLTFTQSLPSLGLPKGLASNVRSAKIDFVAKKGITDFAFIRALRVTVTPNGSPSPIELLDYEKADGAVVGSTLSVDSLAAIDVLEQWTDKAVFDIQVAGTLPADAWAIDLIIHFNGKISYKY